MVPHVHALLPRILAPLLLAGTAAAIDIPIPPPPWSDSFTMPIAGREQPFVIYQDTSWMRIDRRDLLSGQALAGRKDVVIEAKVERQGEHGLRLPGLEAIEVTGDPGLWRTVVDGDNLFLFGRLVADAGGRPRLQVAAIETAPSDRQHIQRQLAAVPALDWEQRLKTVAWIRDQAAVQPNKEFWLNAADAELGQVITAAATEAENRHDIALLNRVVGWCVDLARDPTRAGGICSRPWLQDEIGPAAQELRRRLRRLGLELYQDRWIPRPEALSAEFDSRFTALSWQDAEGFFRLGRWADINAEFLPKAKERAYRCYQAGLRANPDHRGILNALGLAASTARQDTSQATQQQPGNGDPSAAPPGPPAPPNAGTPIPLPPDDQIPPPPAPP